MRSSLENTIERFLHVLCFGLRGPVSGTYCRCRTELQSSDEVLVKSSLYYFSAFNKGEGMFETDLVSDLLGG